MVCSRGLLFHIKVSTMPLSYFTDLRKDIKGVDQNGMKRFHFFSLQGDEIEEFQPLCSVQSDKATIQITSRYNGKVSRLNFIPGDIIKVFQKISSIQLE